MEGSKTVGKCFCGSTFNTADRQMIFLPCGDNICLKCFDSLLQPQESKLICPYDQEVISIPQKLRSKIEEIRQETPNARIICEEHNEEADLYCKEHDTLICHACLAYHQEHMGSITLISKDSIDGFFEKAFKNLLVFSNRIEKSCGAIQDYQRNAESLTPKQFLDIVKEIQSLLQSISEDKVEQQQLGFMEIINQGQLWKINNKEEEQKSEVQEINNIEGNHFCFDKHTIEIFQITPNDQKLIQEWLGKKAKLKILYRGSRDGTSAKKFYEHCDLQGATFSIIKSEAGYVFGGYKSISWRSDQKAEDQNAFLYSLTHKTIHRIYPEQAKYAVQYFSDNLISYSSKNELNIESKYDFKKQKASLEINTSNFGLNYELPYGIKYNTAEARSYLTGSKDGQLVIELEVYKVVFD